MSVVRQRSSTRGLAHCLRSCPNPRSLVHAPPATVLGPFRTDHWSPASAHYWTTAGYEPSAVSDMLLAVSQVYTGNNQVSTMRLPGQPEVEALLTAAAAALDNGTEPAAVAARLDAGVPAALDAGWAPYVLADVSGKGGNSSSSSELPGWLLLYRVQVGYTEPVAPVQVGAGGLPRRGVVEMWLWAIIARTWE